MNTWLMPWFGTTEVGADKFEPCPRCGENTIYGESNGFLQGTEYICDNCGYQPLPSVIRQDKPDGIAVTIESASERYLTDENCFLGSDDDALVFRLTGPAGEDEQTRLPCKNVDFEAVVVNTPHDAQTCQNDTVTIPREDTASDLVITPRHETDVTDILLLLATVDPNTDDPLR